MYFAKCSSILTIETHSRNNRYLICSACMIATLHQQCLHVQPQSPPTSTQCVTSERHGMESGHNSFGFKQFQSISTTSTPILTTATLFSCTLRPQDVAASLHAQTVIIDYHGVSSLMITQKLLRLPKCLDSGTTKEV